MQLISGQSSLNAHAHCLGKVMTLFFTVLEPPFQIPGSATGNNYTASISGLIILII